MVRKIVTMCAAALLACAGAVADDGSDPGVLTPGGWTTDLTVNGKKVWSKYCQPKGAGWSCKYDSKEKCFKLNLSSVTEYTLGGEFTGRVMDKNGNVTKIEVGMVTISQQSTVTLDNLVFRGNISVAAGKTVTLYLKGKNELIPAVGFYNSGTLSIPLNSTVWIDGDKTGSLNVHDCGGLVPSSGGSLVKPGTTKGGCVKVIGGQLTGFPCALVELTVMGGKVEGATVYGDDSFAINVDEFNVTASGNFAGGDVKAKKADICGEVTVSELRVDSLEIPKGTTLTVENKLWAKNVVVDGGQVLLNEGAAIVMSFGGSLTVTDGSILGPTGSILSQSVSSGSDYDDYSVTIAIAGGELDVDSIGEPRGGIQRINVLVSGGRLSFEHAYLQNFDQRGGCVVVGTDCNVSREGNMFLADGSFSAVDVRVEGRLYLRGGSCYVAHGLTTASVVNFIYSPDKGCSCVTVAGLPRDSRVDISDLGFAYGTKDIWSDGGGHIYLWFPNREEPYRFTVNGSVYEATVHGMDTTATLVEAKRYSVTYRTNQGQLYDGVNNCWSQEYLFENLYVYGETPSVYGAEDLRLTCAGKRFDHWENLTDGHKTVMPGENLPPITGDVVLQACWAEDIVADEDNGFDVVFTYQKEGVTGPVIKAVRQRLGEKFAFPTDYSRRIGRKSLVGWFTSAMANARQITADTIADESVKRVYARYLDRTERTTRPDNDAFANAQIIGDARGLIEDLPMDRATKESGEFFYSSSAIAGTLWYRWTAPMSGVVTFSAVNRGDGGAPILCGFSGQMSVPFVGLDMPSSLTFRCTAGMEVHVCVASDGASGDVDLSWNAVSETSANLRVWGVNRYVCAKIANLGITMPAADVKAVKAEGLPKGLKLVQDKAKTAWYVEGVATEQLDYERKYATIRFQFKEKGKADEVQKLALAVVPSARAGHWVGLGEFSMSASELFGAEVRKDWTVSGTPSGVKYDKDALAFSGKLSKIGTFTLTAKGPVTSAVPGSSAKFSNVFTAYLMVDRADATYAGTITVERGVTMDAFNITAKFGWAASAKCKAEGLPPGMKYSAGVFSGKVTGDAWFYPVTVTSADKQAQAAYLVHVLDPSVPEVGVSFGAKELALLKKIAAGDAKATKNWQYSFVRGAAVALPLEVAEGATAKAAGLPSGLKLEQDKAKKAWSITGVPTKAGDFLVTLTVTREGVSSAVTYLFEVVENAFAGEYRGTIVSRPAADAAWRAGTVLVNVAAGGATKVTVSEDGKSTMTYSAKSFGYADSGDYAFVEFELKPSSADKKLGYGVRKGRVTISKPDAEVADCRLVEGAVKFENGTACGEVQGWFVSPGAADAWKTAGADRECRFFSVNDGGFDVPVATVRHEVKWTAKATTANVAGTLYDGTSFKLAKVPLVRDVAKDATGREPRACYSLAPFAVTAKDGQVFVFHGFKRTAWTDPSGFEGRVTFANAEGGVVTAEEESGDAPAFSATGFNSFFGGSYRTSAMTFDWGWDGFETFTLDHASGAAKGDCVVLGADGGEVTRIPAKSQIGTLGDFTYKFTTKDKAYAYEINLVTAPLARYLADGSISWQASGRVVGFVTKTWKEGKETKSLGGIVDVVGLEPAE